MGKILRRLRGRDLGHHVALALLWSFLVFGAIALLGEERFAEVTVVVRRRSADAAWVAPLAFAAALSVIASRRLHRRWPGAHRRGLVAALIFPGFYALVAAVGFPAAIVICAVIVMIGLLAFWALVLPQRLAPPVPSGVLDSLSDRDRLEVIEARTKLQNDLRTTALQAIAGVAVLAGALLAFQQLSEDRRQSDATRQLSLRGQASERFAAAVDALGSERPEAQLGGIYGLEQIAQQAPENQLAITEVLVAYIHRRSPRTSQPRSANPSELRARAPEVQAALTVLVRRNAEITDPPLNLSNLDLSGAQIVGPGVVLMDGDVVLGAPPESSHRPGYFDRANFRGTDLRGAIVTNVRLYGADFGSTDLRGADLTGVDGMYKSPNNWWTNGQSMDSMKWKDAVADASTAWPIDFDWRAAGVKLEQN